jgi:hypothetical protein
MNCRKTECMSRISEYESTVVVGKGERRKEKGKRKSQKGQKKATGREMVHSLHITSHNVVRACRIDR